jgi:TolB-like protein
VSSSLEHTILRALTKNREARLPSAADLRGALGEGTVTPPVRRTNIFGRVAAVAAVLAVAAAAVFLSLGRESSTTVQAEKVSVAVLPFRAQAVSQPLQFLGVGIPDAIISRLAQVTQLSLRPTMAVLKYERENVDPREAGKALAADYVVTGLLQEAGDRLGLSVQLVRVATGAPIWGDRYDVERADLLTLQDRISQSVADALEIQMSAAERERLFRRYTANAAAYERYLQGRATFHSYTDQTVRAAIETFEEALKLDPGFAPARAGVALASAIMRLRFAPSSEHPAWVERAEREARAALQIDPQLAEAHEALAAVYRAVDFDWGKTLDESRLALTLNPSLDQPHLYRAAAFYHLGLFDQVEPELRAAAAGMTPANQPLDNRIESERLQAFTTLLEGRFDQAVPLFEGVRQLSKSSTYDYLLGLSYYYTGNVARAEEILARLPGTTTSDRRAQAVRASLLAAMRADGEARALVKTILDGGYMDHHIAYSLGATFAQLGDPAEANRWLKRAAGTGLPCYPWYVRDPLLTPLRSDREFQQFLGALETSWRMLAEQYSASTG